MLAVLMDESWWMVEDLEDDVVLRESNKAAKPHVICGKHAQAWGFPQLDLGVFTLLAFGHLDLMPSPSIYLILVAYQGSLGSSSINVCPHTWLGR